MNPKTSSQTAHYYCILEFILSILFFETGSIKIKLGQKFVHFIKTTFPPRFQCCCEDWKQVSGGPFIISIKWQYNAAHFGFKCCLLILIVSVNVFKTVKNHELIIIGF